MSHALKMWGMEQNNPQRFSSLLLGKIWTRLHYCLNQVSESARNKVKYDNVNNDAVLGVVLARYVWTIINAALIEECRFGYQYDKDVFKAISKARNVETSPRELVKNINELAQLKSDVSKLPFTMTLLTCPLFWPFLGEKELNDSVYKVLPTKFKKLFREFSSIEQTERLKISALPIVGCFVNKG